MADADDRKKRIMEHISRSVGDFSKDLSPRSLERRQRVMDHVRRTQG